MLLTNYAIRNANQSRALGGNLDPTYNYNLNRMYTFYVGANNVVSVTDRASQPQFGLRPPYSLVVAPKNGGMSMSSARGVGSLSFSGVAGLSGSVTMAGVGTLEATGGLLAGLEVTMAGTGNLAAIGGGLLEALVTMAGTGALSGALGATAGMTVTMPGVGTLTASPQGTGQMELIIYVNQSQATVDQIVDGVVDGIGSITATIPDLLNTETGDIIIPLS